MFELDSKGTVRISPEYLTIKEFKELLDSDKYDKVLPLFSYIFFKHDYKSPYRKSFTPEVIEIKLKEDVLMNKKWTANKLVLAAEEKYKELRQTKSLKALQAGENALAQINRYFNEFDIDEIPLATKHTIVNNMMRNLKELDEVIAKIENARKRVEEELTTKTLSGKKRLRKRELPKDKR